MASPDAAKAAFTATIQPIEVGREVSLQVQRGSSWRTVATVSQDRSGRAQFAAPASADGQPLTYRVSAAGAGSLTAIESRAVSTERWLTPTWTDEFSGDSLSRDWIHRGRAYEPQSFRSCSRGSAEAVRVGGGAVRLSVIRDRSQARLVPRAEERAGRRQVRLPPQRPHRHRQGLLVQVRRRRRPHQVPTAARPARQLLDAAGRRDVPRRHRPRDRRHRVLRPDPPPQRPLQLHPPLRGQAASSRPAPTSPTRSSTARATAGGRASTSSPCSGRRGR